MHKLGWTSFQGITNEGEFDGDSDLVPACAFRLRGGGESQTKKQ